MMGEAAFQDTETLTASETDPSALVAANENEVAALKKRGAINADQAQALLTDASPRTLYVSRKLVNASEFIACPAMP